MQHGGDVVDRRGVGRVDHRLLVDVAHQRDLLLVRLRHRPVAAQHERVGLDADRAQHRDGVLRRLRLLLAGGVEVGHEGDVHEEHVAAAELVPHLAGGLEERLALDVADRAADLGDDHVRGGHVGRLQPHPAPDLVGDVRDHLDRVAEVLPAALLRDHLRVDLAGGHVRGLVQVDVDEPLVVADVEVGLGAVVGHEDLAVLERVHGARIDVEVRIQLLHDHAQPARRQQVAEARGGQPLAERGDHAPGDEDVLRRPRRSRIRPTCFHGIPS